MSTNQIADMPLHSVRKTILTNANGRIVDVVLVVVEASHVTLLTSTGAQAQVQAWLERFIFFQDDVRIENGLEGWRFWSLFGYKALDEAAWIDARVRERVVSGRVLSSANAILWPIESPSEGYSLLLSPDLDQAAGVRWMESRPEPEAQQMYERLRIEAGLPAVGREITPDSIPLEVGLDDAVHPNKGCYIGQEILERMRSRGRVARRLVGISLEGPVDTNAQIRRGGKAIGWVTSVANSPERGWIALGLVRPDALAEPEVRIDPQEVRAELHELPHDHGTPTTQTG